MSLFPAYLTDEPEPSTSNPPEAEDWLENRSFPVQLPSSSEPQSFSRQQRKSRRRSRSTSDESPERKKVKSKKRSRSRDRTRSQSRERSRRRSRSRSRRRSQSRERSRRRSRSRSRSKKKSSKKKDEKKRIPTKEELVAKYSNKKTFLEDVGLKSEDAFRKDERRNAHYLTLKSLPISETALYNARWKRELLTKSGRNRFLKEDPKNSKNVVRFFHKEFQRAFLKSDKRGELIDLSQALKRPEITSRDFRAAFLKLSFEKTTESDSSDKPKTSSSDLTNPDKDDSDDFKLHEIQVKTKEFNEKLRRNPRDEKSWIEFVDFQDQVLRDCSFEGEDDQNGGKSKSKSGNPVLRQRAVAEKKLSVLRTALQDNPNSIPLLTKRLKISAEILDSATLEKEWKELLFRYPASIPLWKSYLRFLSSQFSTFSVAKTIDVLSSCVDRFSKIPGSNENHILFVIQWAANIWSNSGYRERGVGLYQALMELNFDSPSQIPENYSLEDRLALFEQFWDCSAPRFGDQGAVGWQNVLRNKTASMVEGLSTVTHDEDQLLAEAGGRVEEAKLWLALELHRETHHWQPYRSAEEESDDPDRAVSFDDLKPFLFVFQEPSSRFKLALSFFTFLGCDFSRNPMSSLGGRIDFDFSNLRTETMGQWLGFFSPDAISVELEGSLLQRSTPDLASDPSLQTFARNVFVQGLSSMQDPLRTQFCVLWLQFEQEMLLHAKEEGPAKKRQLKEMKNSVKKLLESDRNNILIYCAYAQALHRLESYQSSRKVLQTVLSVDKSSHLYRFAVGLELEAHLALTSNDLAGSPHLDESIWLLSLMATGQPYRKKDVDNVGALSLAHQAKSFLTKKVFEETKEEFRYDGPAIRSQSPVVLQSQLFDDIFCLVWLTALIDSESDDEIDTIVIRVCEDLKDEKNSFEAKLFVEQVSTKLRLDVLSFHWSNRSPTKARSILKDLLGLFPSNPAVLEALENRADLRPTVSNPFWRDSLKVLSGKNVSSAHGLILMTKILVSKFMEACQEDGEEGIVNPVAVGYLNKALYILNDATQKDELKQVVVIWRLLMWVTKTLAEINPKKFNQDSIKSIFYRAIQECPCAKVLYLDLMNYANRSEGQVQAEIEEILNEKEVRVRLPAEELKVLLEPEEEQQLSD